MSRLIYILARALIVCLQALPLPWVARLGRAGGGFCFLLDARHRRVALGNLTLCFGGEKSTIEIRALALENFRRIGETYCCAVKTAGLKDSELRTVLKVTGVEGFDGPMDGPRLQNRLFATGHFGNFELFSRLPAFISGYRHAATYRALRPASLNQLLESLRTVSGIQMFERRSDAPALRKAMSEGGMCLSLFSDQSARDHGLELPFLGHACFTTPAPAIFALRYECSLFVPICYRTSLGHWCIEVGAQIPTHENGRRRSVEAITRELNTAMEAAVRRDPANWFWVHNRWKKARQGASVAPASP